MSQLTDNSNISGIEVRGTCHHKSDMEAIDLYRKQTGPALAIKQRVHGQ
jgi:hypothetical protein